MNLKFLLPPPIIFLLKCSHFFAKLFTGFVFRIFFVFSLSFLSSFLSVYEVKANTVSSTQGAVDVLERLNTGGVDLTCESCTHFSDPSSSDCPKEWLKLAVLRGDERGSVISPGKQCIDEVVKLPSSREPLKTANEVEVYLRGQAGFSSLKGVPVISQCLSEPVKVSRVGNWSATAFNRTLPESNHKVALAEYYSDLHRLDRGMGEAVDNIAAIDRLIAPAGDELLKDVSCSKMLSKEAEESCKAVSQCKSGSSEDAESRQSAMNQAAHNTIIAMQAIDEIEAKINQLKIGHIRLRPKDWKEQEERLESSKRDIENLYPWVVGRKFQSAYSADDFKGFTSGDADNKELVAKMSGIITEQLTHTREKLQERQEEMYQVSRCLTENKFCNDVDIEKVLSTTRPLDEEALFASTEDLKSVSSSALFSQVNCLQEQRRIKAEMNKELAFAGLDVALVAGTMGLGSGIVGAKIAMVKTATSAAMRVGGSVSKGRKVIGAQRLQGLGVIGADTGISTPFMREAMKQCDSLLNQLESIGETQTKDKEDLCEDMSLQVKHTSDLKGCMLQAGLASLPAVFGIGALAGGVSVGTRVASKALGDVEPQAAFAKNMKSLSDELLGDVEPQAAFARVAEGARNKAKAEEVLGKKLTDEQAEAVQKAHLVGAADELGKDGINPPGIGNYTEAQLREKNKILQAAGFSPADRRSLMESGVVGRVALQDIQRLSPSKIAKLSKEEIQQLSPENIASFTKEQFQALGDKVQHLTSRQLRALGDKVQHFTSSQVTALGDKVQHLTSRQLRALGDSVSGLPSRQLWPLGTRVSAFSPSQVTALGDNVRYLTSLQFRALGDSVSGLTLNQMAPRLDIMNYLPILRRNQMNMLKDDVKSRYKLALSAAVSTMSQVVGLAIGGTAIIGGGVLGGKFLYDTLEEIGEEKRKKLEEVQQSIRDISASDIAKLSREELQKLPPEMFPLFTEEQLEAINTDHLTPEQRRIIEN